jgi:single-strand DNA-binding protein
MAINRSWTGRDGERKEESLFIDATVWDRQAENCCQYLKKGSQIHIEGSLKMDSWDDKTTGEKRSKIKVLADRVQFLDRRGDAGPGSPGGDQEFAPPPARNDAPSRRGSAPGQEGRGPSNGPGRGFGAPGGGSGSPASRRPPAEPEADEDDIPF